MSDQTPTLDDMNARSREVFRRVVEGYLANGDPVGSRTLTRDMSEKVSAILAATGVLLYVGTGLVCLLLW